MSDETTGVTPDAPPAADGAAEPDLDEARAQVEERLAEARQRLSEVPADVVVVNHAMGLYELGAIHLSNQPPALDQAALAIDAFACLVEGLGDRLGANAAVLRDALSNIRLAFVQIKGAGTADDTINDTTDDTADDTTDDTATDTINDTADDTTDDTADDTAQAADAATSSPDESPPG